MALKSCYECQAEVSDKAHSCPKCGAPFNQGSQAYVPIGQPSKSRSTAIALALLLGGLGAHKFYLGRPGWGILYVLFCWTFVPAILGVLEAIAYLSHTDAAFQRAYCQN